MRKGDIGTDVSNLQRRLASADFDVERDGWFGPKTEAAVIAFQRRCGLVADGIAGPKTISALAAGRVDPRLLKQADIDRAADRLSTSFAAIMAVNEVESRGHGFLGDNPVVLFERHIMYRRLADAGQDAERLAATYPELINQKRGGYRGGAQEWFRLRLARAIDDIPAVESASWGQFQIMGYHWQALGYASALDFVAAMTTGEAAQLDAFCRFIEAEPALHKALKARKWAEFAKLYNGPAYKENLYDTKLAAAYARHTRQPELAEAA